MMTVVVSSRGVRKAAIQGGSMMLARLLSDGSSE
jgi:hypothetical protein